MPKVSDIPVCPDPPAARSSTGVTKEYQISLVTPLFGGGVEAGTPDESLPIRGTSIRGQLQFWWRATRGSGFSDREQLFARHAQIWGTTDKASPIGIDVRDVTAKLARPCARYETRNDGKLQLRWEHPFKDRELPYLLFPFQGQLSKDRRTVTESPSTFIETASFVLRLRFPQTLREDVEAAVFAWVNLGGLGARTRRGCGALFCKEFAPKDCSDLERWFKNISLDSHDDVRDWPTTPNSMWVGTEAEGPIEAWRKAVGLLQKFRQGENVGRNKGSGGRPGRSRWPEPETIRHVTGRRSSQHARLAHVPDDAFPSCGTSRRCSWSDRVY